METRITQKITQQLRSLISQGEYKAGSRLETERELCTKFGTSRRSLRSAMAKLEKDGLLERIPHRGAVVRRTDDPKKDAANLNSTHALMFVRWNNDALMTEITNGILRMAGQYEDQPVIIDARCSHQRYLDAIKSPPLGIRGMILVPFDHPDYQTAVENAMGAGMKIVLADRILDRFDLSSVTADNFSGGYLATRHLIKTHGRPVYFVGNREKPTSAWDRYLGYVEAMKEHGFKNGQEHFLELKQPEFESTLFPEENWQETYEIGVRLFSSGKEDRYCIFVVNDFDTLGIYQAARKCGLKIGENVFVVGFDDLPLCKRQDPPLSSVLQHREQMGYEAAKLLYQEINGQLANPVHRVLPVELHIRQSSTGSLV